MKTLITALSLGAGIAATALIIAIQQDPFALTSIEPEPPPVSVQARIAVVAEPEPLLLDAPELQPLPRTITIDEVTIRARPTPRVRPRPVQAVEPETRVVPAPCVDGEYRKLDEHRGVTLMCPGTS